jgi:tetratricopeptide (TPR) repeat protein
MAAALAFVLGASSCSVDPAEREYFSALRGEETGMTRTEQIERIDHAIALSPRRVSYRETHAIYSIDLHRFAQAQADLDTAILLLDRPYLRFLRGLVSCQQGNFTESLTDFDVAIAGQPENDQFYRGRALARAAVGRYRDALADAEHLVSVAPQRAESYYARGVALSGLGRDRDAILDFSEAHRRRPELVYPLHARALTYDRLGDQASASADREEARRREEATPHCAVCLDPFRY